MNRRDQALRGLATGIILGLSLTLAVGFTMLVLAHLCILPVAPWCAW